jgi:hypothetical protein
MKARHGPLQTLACAAATASHGNTGNQLD